VLDSQGTRSRSRSIRESGRRRRGVWRQEGYRERDQGRANWVRAPAVWGRNIHWDGKGGYERCQASGIGRRRLRALVGEELEAADARAVVNVRSAIGLHPEQNVPTKTKASEVELEREWF
jgi:hypothetical protein